MKLVNSGLGLEFEYSETYHTITVYRNGEMVHSFDAFELSPEEFQQKCTDWINSYC